MVSSKKKRPPEHCQNTTFETISFSTNDMTEAFSLVCKEVQQITGFDRVLIYQFSEDFSGSVVAEERREYIPSLLNHRFPASDIPKQARELYVKNRIRFVVDVHSAPVPVLPAINDTTQSPLDLSLSVLRSMSPIHIQYLKNMGVSASLSISIVKDGQLWALIACHHLTPKLVNHQIRSLCLVLANLFSAFLARIESEQRSHHMLSMRCLQARVLKNVDVHKNIVTGLLISADDLLALTHATGFAVRFAGKLTTIGLTPHDHFIDDMLEWLGKNNGDDASFETHCLSSVFPGGASMTKSASGILAASIPSAHSCWLVWFRSEVIEEVIWAGNPHKSTQLENGDLNPRKSFESWKELMQGKSLPWGQFDVECALNLRNAIADFVMQQLLDQQLVEIELQKQREHLRDRRNDWLAALAHDLQIPSIGANRLLDFLLNGGSEPIPGSLRPLLSALLDSSAQQLRRIGAFIDVFHYEDYQIDEIALSSVDLNVIVATCIQETLLSATTKRVDIRTIIDQSAATVIGEPTAISRLLLNLLENAIKFSPEGGVVELFVEPAGTQTEIRINDNGPGISEENQEYLFDSFWQGGKPGKLHAGVGMGLYLCRQIARALGGEVSCSSTIGNGATFTVSLQSSVGTECRSMDAIVG
ncbi:ATP-binding protein [soil metagenome]